MMKILIVDDFGYFRSKVHKAIKEKFADIEIDEAGSVSSAIHAVTKVEFDMILLDLDLTGNANTRDINNDGLEVVRHIIKQEMKMPHIVIVSAKVNVPAIKEAFKLGISSFISKPYKIDDIERAIFDYRLKASREN